MAGRRVCPRSRGGRATPAKAAANPPTPPTPRTAGAGHRIVHVQKNNAASTTAFSSLGLSAPTMRAINEV